jgi:hypothetical protein
LRAFVSCVDLASRAVACKGWQWMPGMKWTVYRPAPLENYCGRIQDEKHAPFRTANDQPVPDLTDPATLGCLLALVRAAWRCPTVYARQCTTRRASDGLVAWEVCDLYLDAKACQTLGLTREGSVLSWGHASEAQALVSSLENAP